MLGSVSEAEDVVQEAFLRMHQTLQRDEPIASPRAYIATLVTRLAIDQLRWNCWRRLWRCTPTAAARCRRWRGRSMAGSA